MAKTNKNVGSKVDKIMQDAEKVNKERDTKTKPELFLTLSDEIKQNVEKINKESNLKGKQELFKDLSDKIMQYVNKNESNPKKKQELFRAIVSVIMQKVKNSEAKTDQWEHRKEVVKKMHERQEKGTNNKTHTEFRSDLARKIRDRINEMHEQLRQIDWLPDSEEVKQKKADEIREIFNKEIDEMRKNPQYDEALIATRNLWMIKWKMKKSESKVNKLQEELESSQNEEKIRELEDILEKENNNLKELWEWYLDAQLNLWEEPGDFISWELVTDIKKNVIGRAELRKTTIDWVDFKYKIYRRDWVVDDCVVFDSHEINDKKTIKKFITKIVSYYPEFLIVRGKTSYFLEWLAHNCMYELNYKRNHTWDVDLDIYEKWRRILYTLVWIPYWLFWPKKNKKVA